MGNTNFPIYRLNIDLFSRSVGFDVHLLSCFFFVDVEYAVYQRTIIPTTTPPYTDYNQDANDEEKPCNEMSKYEKYARL